MEKLTITKDKVLEAASKCDTAKQTLKILFPEVFEEEVTYSIGQRFENTESGMQFILALVDPDTVSLISLVDGNRYCKKIKVENVTKITEMEMQQIPNCEIFRLIIKQ